MRFDDEEEYIGRAIDDPLVRPRKGRRGVAGHPVILSALFDDGGTLRGAALRQRSARAPHERRMAHMLRLAVINRYGP